MSNLSAAIILMIVNEVCGSNNSQPKNMGRKTQCLQAPVKTPFIARESFAFETKEDFRNETKWLEAIANKDIVPFPFVDAIEANNTDPTVYNGRFKDITTKEGVRGSSYRLNLAICTFAAAKSYENSEYTRIFKASTENEVTCDVMDDGTVKGEALSSYQVSLMTEATDSDPSFANVLLKYKSEFYSVLKPNFEVNDLEGIVDVEFEQVSASATSVKFKVKESCTGALVKNLADGNVVLSDTDDAAVTTTFVAADSEGVYELTGTDFATDFTLSLDGIISQTEVAYESTESFKITVS